MTTVSFQGGRTVGALGLSFKAISCGINDNTSFGACSASSSSQSKPASPITSVVMGLPKDNQQPTSGTPACSCFLKALGKAV